MATITYGDHTYGRLRIIGCEAGEITVGRYCSIAKHVNAFMDLNHNTNVISTFPFRHRHMRISRLIKKPALPETQAYVLDPKNLTIGNDVWIGYGTILFSGVTVGDGACIGAFSKITKDIPPYSVVVGYSRILRKRFSDEDIKFLLDFKWWDMDDQTVADLSPILHSPDVNLLREWANNRRCNPE